MLHSFVFFFWFPELGDMLLIVPRNLLKAQNKTLNTFKFQLAFRCHYVGN